MRDKDRFLIARPWTKVAQDGSKMIDIRGRNKHAFKLKLMHWNILGQVLATADSFPKVPADYLQWKHRLPLILDHIRCTKADVIGLCEVDTEPYQ